MFGKNPFRLFLYLVLAIVIGKLCYNLGYSFVTKRFNSTREQPRPTPKANRQAEGLRGVTVDPADSAEAARMAAPGK